MATIANTNIVYQTELLQTGEGQYSNVVVAYAGTTVNGVTNVTSIGASVDYTELLRGIANSSSNAANNTPINYTAGLYNLVDSSNTIATNSTTIANEFIKLNNSINVFLGYISTISNTLSTMSGTQLDISNTHSDLSNTMIVVRNDISEITNRANTRTKGLWVNNDANTPFTRAQSRALAMAAIKDSGGVDKLKAEINNPTSLPGDE